MIQTFQLTLKASMSQGIIFFGKGQKYNPLLIDNTEPFFLQC